MIHINTIAHKKNHKDVILYCHNGQYLFAQGVMLGPKSSTIEGAKLAFNKMLWMQNYYKDHPLFSGSK